MKKLKFNPRHTFEKVKNNPKRICTKCGCVKNEAVPGQTTFTLNGIQYNEAPECPNTYLLNQKEEQL